MNVTSGIRAITFRTVCVSAVAFLAACDRGSQFPARAAANGAPTITVRLPCAARVMEDGRWESTPCLTITLAHRCTRCPGFERCQSCAEPAHWDIAFEHQSGLTVRPTGNTLAQALYELGLKRHGRHDPSDVIDDRIVIVSDRAAPAEMVGEIIGACAFARFWNIGFLATSPEDPNRTHQVGWELSKEAPHSYPDVGFVVELTWNALTCRADASIAGVPLTSAGWLSDNAVWQELFHAGRCFATDLAAAPRIHPGPQVPLNDVLQTSVRMRASGCNLIRFDFSGR